MTFKDFCKLVYSVFSNIMYVYEERILYMFDQPGWLSG